MNINIKTFNKWATLNKDKSMAEGHYSSVMQMISMIKEYSSILSSPFSFLDMGCGNGWVVRKITKNNNCQKAIGIDGSENMIKKANSFKIGDFLKKDIEYYKFTFQFDIIFSMETFYYLKNPQKIIKKIHDNGLKKSGVFIMGIDHYKENTPTLSWGEDYNLDLNTIQEKEWINFFHLAGFNKVISKKINAKKNNLGTLAIIGIK